jgi:hypothetical protein
VREGGSQDEGRRGMKKRCINFRGSAATIQDPQFNKMKTYSHVVIPFFSPGSVGLS